MANHDELSRKLLRMATQIADFWRYQPDQPPEIAIAGHINDFWSYQMRMDLLALLKAGEPADPLVAAAAEYIRLPSEPSEGARPTDPLSHQE